MKAFVCSGKAVLSTSDVYSLLDRVRAEHGVTSILRAEGGSMDQLVDHWARRRGLPVEVARLHRRAHGRNAAQVRDETALANGSPDLVVIMPGTTVAWAQEKNARVFGVPVVRVKAPKHVRVAKWKATHGGS